MANFGVGVGDIIAIGTLAVKVYRICSNAAGNFQDFDWELESFRAVLATIEREFPNDVAIQHCADLAQRVELKKLLDSAQRTLAKIEKKLERHARLRFGNSTTWDKFKFGRFDSAAARSALAAHTNALSVFLSTLSTQRLCRIEHKLEEVIEDFKRGRRPLSMIADPRTDYDWLLADIQWHHFEDELVQEGFVRTDIASHRRWFEDRVRQIPSTTFSESIPEQRVRTVYEVRRNCHALNNKKIQLVKGDHLEPLDEIDKSHVTQSTVLRFLHSRTSDVVHVRASNLVQFNSPYPPMSMKQPLKQPANKTELEEKTASKMNARSKSQTQLPLTQLSETRMTENDRARSADYIAARRPLSRNFSVASRASSVASTVRTEISNYDSDGRLVKSKTVITTFSSTPTTPNMPRRLTAPPALQHEEDSGINFSSFRGTRTTSPDLSIQSASPSQLSEFKLASTMTSLAAQLPTQQRIPKILQASELLSTSGGSNTEPPADQDAAITWIELYTKRTRQLKSMMQLLVHHQLLDVDYINYSEDAIDSVDSHITRMGKDFGVLKHQITRTGTTKSSTSKNPTNDGESESYLACLNDT